MSRAKAFGLLASLVVNLAAYLAGLVPAMAEEPVRILATGVFATSLQSLAKPFEAASGYKIQVSIANAGEVASRVASGEATDLVMSSSSGIKAFVQQNALAPNETVIGRMRLGVAIRSGAAMPDLNSTEAFSHASPVSRDDCLYRSERRRHLRTVFRKDVRFAWGR